MWPVFFQYGFTDFGLCIYGKKALEVCCGFVSVLLGLLLGWNDVYISLEKYPFS
jgi:hypothetical protein